MIEISFDEALIAQAARLFKTAPKEADRAAASAINRTISHIPKEMGQSAKKRYIVKASSVKAATKKRRANAGHLFGEVTATGSPLPLTAFKISGGKRGPMHVKVLRKGSPKPVKGLFLNRFPGGFVGHMQRRSPARFPLKTPAGPSIPQMIGEEHVFQDWGADAKAYLNERLAHEIDFRFSKLFK